MLSEPAGAHSAPRWIAHSETEARRGQRSMWSVARSDGVSPEAFISLKPPSLARAPPTLCPPSPAPRPHPSSCPFLAAASSPWSEDRTLALKQLSVQELGWGGGALRARPVGPPGWISVPFFNTATLVLMINKLRIISRGIIYQ